MIHQHSMGASFGLNATSDNAVELMRRYLAEQPLTAEELMG